MADARAVYMQGTTGVLHLRKNCGVTRRTRYSHFEVEFTDERRAGCTRCAKCWDGFKPDAPADNTNTNAPQAQKEVATVATETKKQTLEIPADYRDRVLAAVAKGEKYSTIEKALIADGVTVPGKGSSHYPLIRRVALEEFGSPDKVKALRPKPAAKAPAEKKQAAAKSTTGKPAAKKSTVKPDPKPSSKRTRSTRTRSSAKK